MLSACVFTFLGTKISYKERQELSKTISGQGGRVSYALSAATTHILTTAIDIEHSAQLENALLISPHVPVVSCDWLRDSVRHGVLRDTGAYLLRTAPDAQQGVWAQSLKRKRMIIDSESVPSNSDDAAAASTLAVTATDVTATTATAAAVTATAASRKWRTARIFISSTFRDMHGERDHLTRNVFPELQQRADRLRVHVTPVDLRWGVTEDDTRQALELCLSEVDNCRPFFVGMLGERYGWVPDEYDLPDEPCYEWLRSFPRGRSITHLEQHYGVLRDPARARYVMLLRDAGGFLHNVPPAHRADFETEPPPPAGSAAAARPHEHAMRLFELKDDIRAQCDPHRVAVYRPSWRGVVEGKPMVGDLEEFGAKVLETLWQDLLAEFPPDAAAPDALHIDRSYHDGFVENHARGFIGRQQLLFSLWSYCSLGDQFADSSVPLDFPPAYASSIPLVIVGEPGGGKTSLVAAFVHSLRQHAPSTFLVTHFVGAAPGSTDMRRTLRRLCQELMLLIADCPAAATAAAEAAVAEGDGVASAVLVPKTLAAVPDDYGLLKDLFPVLLSNAARAATAAGRRVVVLIDALNQFGGTYNESNLEWLPQCLPSGLSLIVSTLEGPWLDKLRRRSINELSVGKLSDTDRREIVRTTLWHYRKKLSPSQMNDLLLKTDAHKPLYLVVACEELRVFGVFEKLSEHIASMAPTIPLLFQEVLQRLELDHGLPLVQVALSLLQCSRGGLLEHELLSVLDSPASAAAAAAAAVTAARGGSDSRFSVSRIPEPVDLSPVAWVRLYRSLRPFLRPAGESGEGVLDFFHRQLAKAVRFRYLRSATAITAISTSAAPAVASAASDLTDTPAALKHHATRNSTHAAAAAAAADDEVHRRASLVTPSATPAFTISSSFSAFSTASATATATSAATSSATSVPVPFRTGGGGGGGGGDADGFRRSMHAALGHYFYQTADPDSDLTWRGGAAERAVSELVYHLTHACCYELLARVLTDLQFVELKCTHGMAFDLVADYLAVDLAEMKLCHTAAAARDTEEFRRFVQSRTHTLHLRPSQVFPCAMSLPSSTAPCKVAVNRFATGRESRPYLGLFNRPASASPVLMTFTGHSQAVRACSMCPRVDRLRIASASDDTTVKIWDAQTGKEVLTLQAHSKAVTGCEYSPDGTRLVTSSSDKSARVWDPETGELQHNFTDHVGPVHCAAWDPTGVYVASASADKTVKVWRVGTEEVRHTLESHSGSVNCVAWCAVNSLLSSCSDDRSVRIWKVLGQAAAVQRTALRVLQGATRGLLWCAFSPDGAFLAACGETRTALVWSTAAGTNQPLHTLSGHKDTVCSVSFKADNTQLVTSSCDNTIVIWDLPSCTRRSVLLGHTGTVFVARFTPDGKSLLTCAFDRSVKLWEPAEIDMMAVGGHTARVLAVAYSRDGTLIATGARDKTAMVWQAATGRPLCTLLGHTSNVQGVAFSPDSLYVVTASRDASLRVWETSTGKQVALLKGHCKNVNACDWSPTGQFIVSVSDDKLVKLWNAQTFTEVATLYGHREAVNCCAFSPDGSKLVTGSSDLTLKLWSPQRRSKLGTMCGGHTQPILCCAWSPDGKRVASGADDWTVRVWSAENSKKLAVISTHTAAVTSVSFSEDGSSLLSGSTDSMLLAWSTINFKETCAWACPSRITCTAAGRGGDCKIAVGDGSGQLHLLQPTG